MNAMTDLYPDWKNDIISKEEYLALKQTLTDRISALDAMIRNLEKTASEYEKGVTGENEFIAHFIKYKNIQALSRPMVVELIDEILVHEGGRIEITLKFQDAYKKLMEYIELNKDAIA